MRKNDLMESLTALVDMSTDIMWYNFASNGLRGSEVSLF